MGSSAGHVVAGLFFWGLGYFLCHHLIVQIIREQLARRQRQQRGGGGSNSRKGTKTTMLQQQNRLMTGGGGLMALPKDVVSAGSAMSMLVDDDDNEGEDPISRIVFAYPKVMKVGIVGVLFVIIFIEWPNAFWSPVLSTELHVHIPHIFLYTGYLMTMIAVLLEKNKYLPFTSWTWMLAVANVIGYVVWGSHAKHQVGAESIFHTFMAEACFIAALFTILLAMMQLCKQRDLLHVSAFASFFMILLQGTIMFSIAVWYFKWYDPLRKSHFDVPPWQVPCVFAASVFSNMAFMAGVWNYIRYKEGTITTNTLRTTTTEHHDRIVVDAHAHHACNDDDIDDDEIDEEETRSRFLDD